jgi:hypothetical protein
VLILKVVQVICFDALLQVLILKGLYCTKIVQNGLFRITVDSKGIRFQGCRRKPEKEKRQKGTDRSRGKLPHSKSALVPDQYTSRIIPASQIFSGVGAPFSCFGFYLVEVTSLAAGAAARSARLSRSTC